MMSSLIGSMMALQNRDCKSQKEKRRIEEIVPGFAICARVERCGRTA